MNKINVIGFDGLHRCGKGTQINLLGNYLSSKGVPFLVARGDGTRRGQGIEPYDPKSSWWKDNYSYFFQKEGPLEDKLQRRNLLYQRLSREAHYQLNRGLPTIMKETNSEYAFLLMDRTFISRLFSMRQILPAISLEESITSTNPKNNKTVYGVLPEIIFVLNAPKEILIERCSQAKDQPDKIEFRKDNLIRHYELYNQIVDEIMEDQRFNVQIIDGTLPPGEIHKTIKEKIGV